VRGIALTDGIAINSASSSNHCSAIAASLVGGGCEPTVRRPRAAAGFGEYTEPLSARFFDLAHPLTVDAELPSDLVERAGMPPPNPEAQNSSTRRSALVEFPSARASVSLRRCEARDLFGAGI